MERLEFDLSLIARRKFTLATPYNPAPQDTHHNPRDGESRTKKRRLKRSKIGDAGKWFSEGQISQEIVVIISII